MAAYTTAPNVWNPTEAALAAGNSSTSQYNAYRRIQANEPTQLPVWPSVKRFRDVVMTLFPGFSSGGMKRSPRRDPVVGRVRDPHEEGRAIDFMTRNPEVGDPLANWLVIHAAELDVQLVMWRGTEWSASNSLPKWERITGNPHNDHIHMEFNDRARGVSAEEMEQRIRRAFAGNSNLTDTSTHTNTNVPTPILSQTPTVEQSEDTPSADLSQENSRVLELSPEELAEKVSFLQTIEQQKIYIALGVGVIILGSIGYIFYKYRMKIKAEKPLEVVKNGRKRRKIKYKSR